MCEAKQEGIISKKAEAPYRGTRTKCWLKIKCIQRQEFIIIGWTPSDKKGRGFRSLLLAVHEEGELRYVGKVGTGFSMDVMHDLLAKMEKIEVPRPPATVPRPDARGAHWVKPQLVGEIAFSEFTSEGILRHPSFLGLRADKKAIDVVRELPQKAPGRARRRRTASRSPTPDRVLWPRRRHQAGAGRLLPHDRPDDGRLGAGARSPGPLPAGAGEEMLLPEAQHRHLRPHVQPGRDRGEEGRDGRLCLCRGRRGLVACVQMGRSSSTAGARRRRHREPDRSSSTSTRRGPELRRSEAHARASSTATSPTWACRASR
jgi:bifunctional non-homologous end joining protein LigD